MALTRKEGGSLRVKAITSIVVTFVLALLAVTYTNNTNRLNGKIRRLQGVYNDAPALSFNMINENQLVRLTRAFPPRQSRSWCIPESRYDEEGKPAGFIYSRVPKTGSSTITGVALRIAQHYGEVGDPCKVHYFHRKGMDFFFRAESSFLLGSVRNPTSRAMSHVYFEFISRQGMVPSDLNVINQLKWFFGPQREKNPGSGYQLEWLIMRTLNKYKNQYSIDFMTPETLEILVKEVIDEYDFMIVTERMDESLVALQLLLGLETREILYLSSKAAGSYYYDPRRERCIEIKRKAPSPVVNEFLTSIHWQIEIAGDLLLYKAANRCLDATIEQLGRARFEDALARYRSALKQADETCAPVARFPCSSNGEVEEITDCYLEDYGCGYSCLDELVLEL